MMRIKMTMMMMMGVYESENEKAGMRGLRDDEQLWPVEIVACANKLGQLVTTAAPAGNGKQSA